MPFLLPLSIIHLTVHLQSMYGEFDYEGLKARLQEKHRLCIPTGRFEKIKPLGLPRSSRSCSGMRPADHRRCFTATPLLPPISGQHRATYPCAEGHSFIPSVFGVVVLSPTAQCLTNF